MHFPDIELYEKHIMKKFIINTIKSIRFKETPRLSPDHLEQEYIEMKISNYSMCTRRAADLLHLLELCSCVVLPINVDSRKMQKISVNKLTYLEL